MKRKGFVTALAVASGAFALAVDADAAPVVRASPAFAPSNYLTIDAGGLVSVLISKSEMGQGVMTGLAMAVAEELDYPLERMSVQQSPADPRFYDPVSRSLRTDASSSTVHMTEPMRRIGATARAMLVSAAAGRWGVDPARLLTKGDGYVWDPVSGRRCAYGALASIAALQPIPKEIALKPHAAFHTIGTRRDRVDLRPKTNGRAKYGVDVKLPGMRYASIQKSPVVGGCIVSFDPSAALQLKGVHTVLKLSSGVAVVADNTWLAFEGRKRLKIIYDDGPWANLSTAQIFADAERLAASAGVVAQVIGDADVSLSAPGLKTHAALYRGPYLAHSAMEPMNATAWVHDGKCEIWAPTQHQSESQEVAAKITGLPIEQVALTTTLLGGGFGRRSETDFVSDAVETSRLAGVPVQVLYTREDDIQHDFYRAANTGHLTAALDGDGKIVAWKHRVVCTSAAKRGLPSAYKDGLDRIAVNGAVGLPYDIPNVRVEYVEHALPIEVGFWRAPGANWNGFAVESFIDELAQLAGKDPYEFRRMHLKDDHAIAVLDAVAARAGWGKPLPANVYRGIALARKGGDESIAAEVVEASFAAGTVVVHRVVIAAYIGTVINPAVAESQLESAALFGLSAALNGKITFERGRVVQSNFIDAPVLRMRDTPKIEVVIVPSQDAPTGVGELATPAIAPALVNAYFAATGRRVRTLPLLDAIHSEG